MSILLTDYNIGAVVLRFCEWDHAIDSGGASLCQDEGYCYGCTFKYFNPGCWCTYIPWMWLSHYLVFTGIHLFLNMITKNQPQLHKNKSRSQVHDLLHKCEKSTFQFSRCGTPSSQYKTWPPVPIWNWYRSISPSAEIRNPSLHTATDSALILKTGSHMAETPERWTLIYRICASAWHLSTISPSTN